MRKCYICKEKLEKSNSSLELIIPNALGGNLKSRDLFAKVAIHKWDQMKMQH